MANENLTRRSFLTASAAFGAGALWIPGAFADKLMQTPAQTEGPFYPNKMPLDTDNDLLIINDSLNPGVGKITHLTGRILNTRGEPIRNALVEIWQVDNNGAYIHTNDPNHSKRDSNFQGFGRFMTGSTGEYYFRTIKPVPYSGRTAHIHYAVKIKGRENFVTQCYVKGQAENEADFVLRGMKDQRQRDALVIPFTPIKESKIGELSARFDIVLG